MPIQLPTGSEENFQGVVDLIEMKALIWTDELGAAYENVENPGEIKEKKEEKRTLKEAFAE